MTGPPIGQKGQSDYTMKITKTKAGTWTTLVHLYDLDGKRHAKRFTGKTKDDVRQAANGYLDQYTLYTDSSAFSDAMERFLNRSEPSLSPSTLAGYKSNRKMLTEQYAAFCALSCDRITSADVQHIIDDMKRKGRSPKTIKNRLGLISAVLNAEGHQMPSYKAPTVSVPLLNVPDGEIIQKVSNACIGRYKRMAVPLALACFGLRRGEICGVTASDLDGNVLHVKNTIVRDYDGHEHTKPVPKNEQSIRSILLPHDIADQIREQGRAWDGTLKALSDSWPHLCKAAGVEPFRLHDCRHFFVSYCHDVLHLSDSQIMKMGGWKTDNVMKRRYRHAIADESETVVEKIGSLVGSLQPANPHK